MKIIFHAFFQGINMTRELYLKLIVEENNLRFVNVLSDASYGSRRGKMSVLYRQSRHFLSGRRVATQTGHCLSENSLGVELGSRVGPDDSQTLQGVTYHSS